MLARKELVLVSGSNHLGKVLSGNMLPLVSQENRTEFSFVLGRKLNTHYKKDDRACVMLIYDLCYRS